MHCWKVINIKHEYGTTRLVLLSSITFIIVFCFSFISFRVPPSFYKDDYFWLFLLAVFLMYPIHKYIHYISLLNDRKKVKLKFKLEFYTIPIFQIRIKKLIHKNRYIFTLISPFIFLNAIILWLAFLFPHATHFVCLLLAFHCSICIPDILCTKHLVKAPKNAVIEETPKGYEILVPVYSD